MTEYLRIKNWSRYQHYKDRNPPWIKLHQEILSSEDWVLLADASRYCMLICMVVAARFDGHVPSNPAYLKRGAYLDRTPDLQPLIDCGFLVNPQANASDVQADASLEKETYREETETEKKERVLRTLSYQDAFEALWQGWRCHEMPKGSKKKAKDKWTTHVTKPGVDIELVIRGAAAYCVQASVTATKTCYISTWLTHHRWMDDHDLTNIGDDVSRQVDRMNAAWMTTGEEKDDKSHDEDRPALESEELDP